MIITLYKNYPLNNSYDIVCWNNPNVILQSLEKKVFDVDYCYSTLSGNLFLDLEDFDSFDDIMGFNYLTLNDNSLLNKVIYCFIDSIDLSNYNVNISYSTDIWNTYRDFKFERGLLNRCSDLNLFDFKSFKIPLDFSTNNTFSTEQLLPNYSGGIKNRIEESRLYNILGDTAKAYFYLGGFEVFADLQYTELNKGDVNVNDFKNVTVFIGTYTNIIDSEFKRAIDTINVLYKYQSKPHSLQVGRIVDKGDLFESDVENYSYTISSIYIIPRFFNSFNCVPLPTVDLFSYGSTTKPINFNTNHKQIRIYDDDTKTYVLDYGYVCDLNKYEFNFEIPYNNKNVGLIFGDTVIPFENDGNNIKGKITLYYNNLGLNIMMLINGSPYLLNDLFRISMNYDVQTAETTAQRSLAYNIGTMKATLSIASSVMSLGISSTLGVKGLQPKTGKGNSKWKQARSKANLGQEMVSESTGAIGGVIDLIELNTPKYQSFFGKEGASNNIINAINGFCILKNNPYNYDEIMELLKESGYAVNKIIYNLDLQPQNDFVLRFSFVDIGGYPTEITDILTSILETGVKFIV